jgi:gliding motility-associated-like protein
MKLQNLFFPSVLAFAMLQSLVAHSQLHYFEETFVGGVTMGGWSPPVFGSGDGAFDVYVEPGSTIYQAFLVAGRLGPGDGVVTLNGITYNLDATNEVTGPFYTLYGDPSAVHVIDVTTDIDPAINSYTISGGIPYQDFQLVIFYENPSLQPVTAALFLNSESMGIASAAWTLNFDNPISNASDVGMAFFNSYQCDAVFDAENITVNGTYIGTTGSQDYNSGWCTGTLGNFYYQDGTLFGLGDDIADQAVGGAEALSNASALIPNGSTTVDVLFEHVGGGADNHQWSIITVFGSSCDAPTPLFAFNEVCIGEPTTFTDESIGAVVTWNWDFDDSNSSTDQNPVHTFSNPGTYDVTLTVENIDGCSESLTTQVEVFALPVLTILESNGCGGDPFTLDAFGAVDYTWEPGSLTGNSIDVLPLVETTYTLSGVDSNGCSSSIDYTVTPVEPLIVSAEWLSDSSCENPIGGSAQATVSGGLAPYDYQWSPSGGNNATGSNMSAGDYTVQVTDAMNCIAQSNVVTIIQTGLPEITIDGPLEICPGEEIELVASGATTYEWSTGEITPSITVSPLQTTTYWVEGSLGICSNSDSITVQVFEVNAWSGDSTFVVPFGTSILIELPSENIYTWSPGTFLSCSECSNPIILPTETTFYDIISQDPNNGCIEEARVLIIVEFDDAFIPNAITLTNDDLNEVFRVYGGPFVNPVMRIYNRWGIKIFETNDIEKGWNGGIDGYYAPDGVYVYQVEYDTDEGRKKLSGTLTVIR